MSTSTNSNSHPSSSSSSTTPLRAIISPSILSSDFAQLANECERVIAAGADWLHIDVMDGHFVPNLTLGAPIVGALRKHLKTAHFDVHMMVSNPEQWVEDFAKAGATNYTFHIEATKDAGALIANIRKHGMQPGITLKPKTPLDAILPYVNQVDLVLVMSVEPGFGGQSFMPDQMEKVRTLRKAHPTLNIEVDGGLSDETIDQASEAGANVIVSGSAIYKAKDMAGMIKILKDSVEKQLNARK